MVGYCKVLDLMLSIAGVVGEWRQVSVLASQTLGLFAGDGGGRLVLCVLSTTFFYVALRCVASLQRRECDVAIGTLSGGSSSVVVGQWQNRSLTA